MKKPSPLIWNSQRRLLARAVLAPLLLFFLTVGFSLFLSATTLRQYTTDAILNGYGSAASQLQMLINRGLNFGKPLNGFADLQAHLLRTRGMVPGIETIAVYDAQKTLIASTSPPAQTLAMLTTATPAPHTGWQQQGDQHCILPLGKSALKAEGYLVLSVGKQWTDSPYTQYLRAMLPFFLLLGPLACMAQLGWFAYFAVKATGPEHLFKLLRRSVLIVVGGAQAIFIVIALVTFMGELRSASTFSAELSGKFMANNLEILIHHNLKMQNFSGLQAHMEAVLQASPDLSGMRLYAGDTIVTQAGKGFSLPPARVPVYRYWADAKTARSPMATVAIYPNEAYRQEAVQRMLIDQLTALALSFIMLLQLSGFLAAQVLQSQSLTLSAGETVATQGIRIKTAFFCFFCAYDFVLSFIPLAAAKLPSALLPLSPTLHNALPISAEAVFATLAVMNSGILERCLGWQRMLRLAVVSGMLGALLAFFSTDIAMFIAARACSGFAMGLMIMSGQFSVIQQAHHADKRLDGLAGIYAALFAGSICGSASGGMLYDMFSANVLFGLSGLLMLVPLLILLPLSADKTVCFHHASTKNTQTWKALLTPSFLVPLLLISVPGGIALTGFLYLTFPTTMKQLSIEQADIGRIFMIYGFCFVFIGPTLAKFTQKFRSQAPFVALTGITGGAAMLVTSLLPTFWGFALAALLMGISQCLLASSMMVYVLSLPALQDMESTLVGSVCRMCERAGQIAGPLLFGAALTCGPAALPTLGISCMACAVIFLLCRCK